MATTLQVKDKMLLSQKGISEEKLESQLQSFRNGFPFLKLYAAAAPKKGILQPSNEAQQAFLSAWQKYLTEGHKIIKFVPASGAASRMFKDLFAFCDADYDTPQTHFEQAFFHDLHKAPYYSLLNETCLRLYGQNIAALLQIKRYKDIVRALLGAEGLNYGNLPKGLLLFHQYQNGNRTPVEEHLIEGGQYAKGADEKINIHFTVSPEHRELFSKLIADKSAQYEKELQAKLCISFSEQKGSTDTIAVTEDNDFFRQADGSLLFRPGGHGALIENLNEIDADIVFIKNIDNVVPDHLKPETVHYKQLLAGILVELQQKTFHYLRLLDEKNCLADTIKEIKQFIEKDLCCILPQDIAEQDLVAVLKEKLNRPMRVCGMVANEGEPGGGPFLVYNADGSISLQILESSQIDLNNPEKKAMCEEGLYFNPVDLVCALKDYKGKPFNLPDYVDPATGFITHKSKDGKQLKALELPGLWNGAMSNWNTVFVEVPLITFNPVKTINDLFRPQHQPADGQ